MFENLFKKIVPLAATAGLAYTGASMLGGLGGTGQGIGPVGSNLFSTSSLKEKLLGLAKKEALKKGAEAVFGGEDDFTSPYETASVNFDPYRMTIGGVSKGGVIGFPGAIKTADPEVISYQWKQRMNTYIS